MKLRQKKLSNDLMERGAILIVFIFEKINNTGKGFYWSFVLFTKRLSITGWTRLIRNDSAATFSFKLNGNSIDIFACNSNFSRKFKLQLFSINKCLLFWLFRYEIKANFKGIYFFVCSMCRAFSCNGPSPWPTHCMCSLQSVGQVKWFIEWLSQYIAPGRLSTWSPP